VQEQKEMLQESIDFNPFVGEPHIMLAQLLNVGWDLQE
jgi:hypothetical protein